MFIDLTTSDIHRSDLFEDNAVAMREEEEKRER
jgi:hypothetical protein